MMFSFKTLRFLARHSLAIVSLFSTTALAQEFCQGGSFIDGVPAFIGQAYYDILNRAPDREGQLYHIQAIESLNAANCTSADPSFSAGICEWNNNAQAAVDFLTSPESIAKNGNLSDNAAFVTAV